MMLIQLIHCFAVSQLFTDIDNYDLTPTNNSVSHANGVDLGASYDDGLDSTTNYYNGDTSNRPVIVPRVQQTLWDIGAFVDNNSL